MNTRLCLLLILFTALLMTSCEKDSIEFNSEYQESYTAWKSFKTTSGNSYRYVVVASSWVGMSFETTITVHSGKVTGRSYVRKTLTSSSGGGWSVAEQWEEDEATLNSHNSGAAPRTLDAIYEQAKTDWLKERPDARTYFEANNNGMISNCGYVNNGCADDCFVGITITLIEKL